MSWIAITQATRLAWAGEDATVAGIGMHVSSLSPARHPRRGRCDARSWHKLDGWPDQHRLISEALGDELRQAVQAGLSVADQAGSIRYRVSAVLYLLLRDHSIDRRGRCRSCRRPGAMMTIRRQPCRILIKTYRLGISRLPGKVVWMVVPQNLGTGTPND